MLSDLVEAMGSTKLLTCALPNTKGAAVAHPAAAVFVSAKAKGVKALDAKQVAAELKASGQIAGSSLEAFSALMEANKVKAFVVGAGDAAKGITAAVSGK